MTICLCMLLLVGRVCYLKGLGTLRLDRHALIVKTTSRYLPILTCSLVSVCKIGNFRFLYLLLGATSKNCAPWKVFQLLSQNSSSAHLCSQGTVPTPMFSGLDQRQIQGTHFFPSQLDSWMKLIHPPSSKARLNQHPTLVRMSHCLFRKGLRTRPHYTKPHH